MRSTISYFALTFLSLSSCSTKEETGLPETAHTVTADTLKRIEEQFSNMSEEKGFHAALKAYAASDATKLVEGRMPIIGSDSLAKVLDARPDTGIVVTWVARHADIAASGDIGYTWGDWVLRSKHPKAGDTAYGNFYTIWKKQSDGSWKWVLDGGNSTPKP